LKELPAEDRRRRIEQMLPDQQALTASSRVDQTMSWEQTEQLQAGGVTFGSHSSTHEILTRIPVDEAEHEITVSRRQIQERLRSSCTLFAYPNGNCSPEVRDLVERAGYSLAFLNDVRDVWSRDCDPYMLPRINVCEHHLVDSQGKFSPLIFEYTVVWRAAEGMLTNWWSALFGRTTAANGQKSPAGQSNNQIVGQL
jgi:peptidoglycan/xylan/chitin deacetylase (PgdA/CDA1 family)